MTKDYIAPPVAKDGNPLSAFGVNQIIGSVNYLKSDYFDFSMLKQRTTMFDDFAAWSQRYVLVHAYSHLRIIVFCAAQNSMDNLFIYAKKTGQNQTEYLIHTEPINSVPDTLDITINLGSNPNGFSIEPGETYLISLRNTKANSGMVRTLYMFEYLNNGAPATPTIPTLSDSTVVNATYLNSIINSIRNLPTRPNVNVPFNGIGAPMDYNASGFMEWVGCRRSRYLLFGFMTIDKKVRVRFYVNNQLISDTTSVSTGRVNYNLSYDFQNNPSGITVPNVGSDYTFTALCTYVNEGHPAAAAYIRYAFESEYL
jgi:hypothetical protein